MDFNSLIFLGFFAGVAALTYCFPRQAKPYFLLLASYAFYMYKPQNARLVVLLVSATVVTYCCGIALGSEKLRNKWARRAFLWLALLCCGGILFFYKYFGFFSQLWADLAGVFGGHITAGALDLAAPLGLTYFTFQSLGYVFDVYRGRQKAVLNPVHYALFVSFFPCIFTGPIERAGHLIPQFSTPAPFSYSRMAGGAFRMLWGYFKKMVLADGLGVFVSAVFAAPEKAAGPYLLAASLLFSCQLYLDFSGCCDVAIGGARILGFDLTENFQRPFAATNYSDLWRRWHISLSSWFRDYVYIPMGGNRCAWWRQALNLIVTFLASGLWHGASWGYVIWGALNGLILVIGKNTAGPRAALARHNPLYRWGPLKRLIQRVCVYGLFTFCIVFFCGRSVRRQRGRGVRRPFFGLGSLLAGTAGRLCRARARPDGVCGERRGHPAGGGGRTLRPGGRVDPAAVVFCALAALLSAGGGAAVLRRVRQIRLHLPKLLRGALHEQTETRSALLPGALFDPFGDRAESLPVFAHSPVYGLVQL